MISIELKNMQLRLDQETTAHEKAVASFNADKKRSSETPDFESLQGLSHLSLSLPNICVFNSPSIKA